jgi:mRNA interferase HigB
MHVVTLKHLVQAGQLDKNLANELSAWYAIAKQARWKSFVEVREVFTDADAVDDFVIFNIRKNRFRLVTVIHYSREIENRTTEGHIYIRSVLTHKEYDNRGNWNKGVK